MSEFLTYVAEKIIDDLNLYCGDDNDCEVFEAITEDIMNGKYGTFPELLEKYPDWNK